MNNMIMMLASIFPDDGPVNIVKDILVILMALVGIALVVVVLMQKGTSDNIGTIGGDSETYMGKNKGQDKERLLKRLTVALGCVMVVFSLTYFILAALQNFA